MGVYRVCRAVQGQLGEELVPVRGSAVLNSLEEAEKELDRLQAGADEQLVIQCENKLELSGYLV